MAIPRFSFGSGASGLYNPNQILVPTTLTSADKAQLLDYDKKIADYKAQVDAYNKAVEAHNKSGKGTFSQKEPTDPGITQKEIDTFGAESAARAQQLQTARQNALNILQNPEGFSSYYGIGSLGFEDGGAVSEGIGSLQEKVYKVDPDIFIEYGSGSREIPEYVDGQRVAIREKYKEGRGNLGFNVTTPNEYQFGAGASGRYLSGEVEFPEEIQAFGAPDKINYGEGLTPEQYYAYYSTPEGLSISGNYREGNPDQKSALEIMLSKQIKFKNIDDLTKRIERFIKRR
jgi:hypothetical protein